MKVDSIFGFRQLLSRNSLDSSRWQNFRHERDPLDIHICFVSGPSNSPALTLNSLKTGLNFWAHKMTPSYITKNLFLRICYKGKFSFFEAPDSLLERWQSKEFSFRFLCFFLSHLDLYERGVLSSVDWFEGRGILFLSMRRGVDRARLTAALQVPLFHCDRKTFKKCCRLLLNSTGWVTH